MNAIREVGKWAGAVTGKVLGGTVRVAGELVHSPYIKEIGDSVEHVTAASGDILGQAAGGLWEIGAGLVQKNEPRTREGFGELSQAVGDTVDGVGRGVEYILDNGREMISGLQEGDRERLKQGAKNLGKMAAVGALAIGVIELIDGADGPAPAEAAEGEVVEADADGGRV